MIQKNKSFVDKYGDYLEIEESYEDVYFDITAKNKQDESLNTTLFNKKEIHSIIEFLQELMEEA